MSRQESRALDIPAADGSSTPACVRDQLAVIVAVSGTFDCSIQIEQSFDETVSWHPVGAPLTAAGTREPLDSASHIRATVADYVSGDPVGVVAGRNLRS